MSEVGLVAFPSVNPDVVVFALIVDCPTGQGVAWVQGFSRLRLEEGGSGRQQFPECMSPAPLLFVFQTEEPGGPVCSVTSLIPLVEISHQRQEAVETLRWPLTPGNGSFWANWEAAGLEGVGEVLGQAASLEQDVPVLRSGPHCLDLQARPHIRPPAREPETCSMAARAVLGRR